MSTASSTQPDSHRGTVYGVLLNDRATLTHMAAQFTEPPYKAPPKAPVLYIKPRNTHATDGAAVPIPADPGVVRVDATIGLVIGRTAWRVTPQKALSHVSGFVIVSDITLPHDNYFRPAIRQRCRDLFCPISQPLASPAQFDVDKAELEVTIRNATGNVSARYRRSFSQLVRNASTLLADVTEFMTLFEGDVLLLGPAEGSPSAQPGDTVSIVVPGLGQLRHSLVTEEESDSPDNEGART